MTEELTHFDESGASRMVDTSHKEVTRRVAVASTRISMNPQTLKTIVNKSIAKGDVFEVARLAGIMAAKRTGELIPLCHPIGLDSVEITMSPRGQTSVYIEATAIVHARTGVEMEAMTAASVAALTIYDMCKSIDRSMVVESIQLESKSGGKSGDWCRSSSKTEDVDE